MMKAKMKPDRTLERISGNATFTKAWTRLAPRLIAASSSRGSSPISPAITLRMTNGTQMTTCPNSRLVIDGLMPSRA